VNFKASLTIPVHSESIIEFYSFTVAESVSHTNSGTLNLLASHWICLRNFALHPHFQVSGLCFWNLKIQMHWNQNWIHKLRLQIHILLVFEIKSHVHCSSKTIRFSYKFTVGEIIHFPVWLHFSRVSHRKSLEEWTLPCNNQKSQQLFNYKFVRETRPAAASLQQLVQSRRIEINWIAYHISEL
jgi:hypothetical protein